MGKFEVFLIELDRESAVYFAGEEVVGRLLVVLRADMKMRSIRLKFVGKAHTHWTERRGSGNNRRTVIYGADEVYCNLESTLWGKMPSMGGENPVLQMGPYAFPFRFKLPSNSPTSFEGTYGHIRYSCKAIIDKPWKFDHTTKRAFTVIGIQDLNRDPNAALGLNATNQKVLGMACCPAGQIECQIEIPKRGYVGGECVPILGSVFNNSTRTMKRIEFLLMQRVVFSGTRTSGPAFDHGYDRRYDGHTRQTPYKLVDVVLSQELPAGQSVEFDGQGQCAVRIPPVPPMLLNCRIIHIDYSIVVEVVPHGPSFNLTLELPIIIGSIPLRSTFDQFQTAFSQQTTPESLPSAPPLPMDDYPELPPPSYAESIFGKSNIKEEDDSEYTGGELEFAPRYTYYDWSPIRPPSAPASH